MKINFPVEKSIRTRQSIRNYQDKNFEIRIENEIDAFINSLNNPFGPAVTFHRLDIKADTAAKKLGTYGVIKGASHYIGATIAKKNRALEALGYEFEALVLFLTHLGIGTCWLGGTFNRQNFSKAMHLPEDALFPVISPIGYAANRQHFKEKAMRRLIKADNRKNFGQLFFDNNFETPLTKESAGELAFALEMVRLGPSASNKQPWRILVTDTGCHFYKASEPGYSKAFPYDIQKIDLGIAAAHFDFSVQTQKINGHFILDKAPKIDLPKHMEYLFSWIRS